MDLVYYYVPEDYIFFEKKLKKVYDVNLLHWREIDVADTLDNIKGLKMRERISQTNFFVEKTERLAEFLWELKNQKEELYIKRKLTRFSKEYIQEKIIDPTMLNEKLEGIVFQNYYHAILYLNEENADKIIYISEAEIINIYFRMGQERELEDIIKKWARKTEYDTFQLDLEDD